MLFSPIKLGCIDVELNASEQNQGRSTEVAVWRMNMRHTTTQQPCKEGSDCED